MNPWAFVILAVLLPLLYLIIGIWGILIWFAIVILVASGKLKTGLEKKEKTKK